MRIEQETWKRNYASHSTRFLLELYNMGSILPDGLALLENELMQRGLKQPFNLDRSLKLRDSEVSILQELYFGPNIPGFCSSIDCEAPKEIVDEFHISTSAKKIKCDNKVNIQCPNSPTQIGKLEKDIRSLKPCGTDGLIRRIFYAAGVILDAVKKWWMEPADPEIFFKNTISEFEEKLKAGTASDNSYVCLIYLNPVFALFKSNFSIFYKDKKAALFLFTFFYSATILSIILNKRDKFFISKAIEPVFDFFYSYYGSDSKKIIDMHYAFYVDALRNNENIVDIFSGIMNCLKNNSNDISVQLDVITEVNSIFIEFVPMISYELKKWCNRKDFEIGMGEDHSSTLWG